jgi:hypothetical protein
MAVYRRSASSIRPTELFFTATNRYMISHFKTTGDTAIALRNYNSFPEKTNVEIAAGVFVLCVAQCSGGGGGFTGFCSAFFCANSFCTTFYCTSFHYGGFTGAYARGASGVWDCASGGAGGFCRHLC